MTAQQPNFNPNERRRSGLKRNTPSIAAVRQNSGRGRQLVEDAEDEIMPI